MYRFSFRFTEDIKPAQTDEEKQKERQKIETREREQLKQAGIDAANIKREAREARHLDNELLQQRRAQERERRAQFESTHPKDEKSNQKSVHNAPNYRQLSNDQATGVHQIVSSPQTSSSTATSTPTTLSSSTNFVNTSSATTTPSITGQSILKSRESVDRQTSSDTKSSRSDKVPSPSSQVQFEDSECGEKELLEPCKELKKSKTPSPCQSAHSSHPAECLLETPTIPPTTPIGNQFELQTLRHDSTESEASQQEAACKIMCRAPIASLDCMEEFSGTGGHLDFGRSISLGSNPGMPLRQNATTTPGLRYKNLGKSGLRVSNVGLGTWPIFTPNVSEEQAEAIVRLAVESGINLFDLSEAHSGIRAEIELGRIIQKFGWKRTGFVVITKIYWSMKSEERGLSRKHIIESVRASLQRLQLQYIDVVIVHKADSMCPMEEVVRAMNYVISNGWAMYWGTARWSAVEIMEAYTNCRTFNCVTPIVEQAEYHMFCREKVELYLPEMYNKIGVGLMVWGPLSMSLTEQQNGERLLFPKGSFKTKSHSYSWTEDEVNREQERIEETRRYVDKIRDLSNLAEKLGCSPAQLSIAWSLKHEPVQCLLISGTTPELLHQSLQALQLLPRLSTGVMLELERILDNKPLRQPAVSTLALR